MMKALIFMMGVLMIPLGWAEGLRLNQIQTIGTHNSYHVAPTAKEMKLLGVFSKRATTAWDYTRKPLGEQLDFGSRHFELDVFADPKGGLFADADSPENDPMRQPGIKVLHIPKLDARSVHPTFRGALRAVKNWSDKHPRHVPIMFLIELKDRAEVPLGPRPIAFDRPGMEALEAEILSVFGRDRLITPDFVRGDAVSLRDHILREGWPLLELVRGRVMFCLDNEGEHRDLYLKGNPTLEKRLLFVSVDSKHPAAAWMKRNDPVGEYDEIRKLVRAGFMVRTRADAETLEARANDSSRANKALSSGAQFVSTDFPRMVPRISKYNVSLPGGLVARSNPISKKGKSAQIVE